MEDAYALKSNELRLKYTYRKKHFYSHSIYFGFENRIVSDSILIFNPNYSNNPDIPINYFHLKYEFLADRRDSRVFPTDGYKFEFSVRKNGLYIFPETEINSIYFKIDASIYTKLNNRFSVNNNLTLKKTFGVTNPFFLNSALGYSSNIRAYEYYVVNGSDMVLSKNTLNFMLLPKKIFHIKFIPWEKFNKIHFTIYTGIFADVAYVKNTNETYNQLNSFANTFLYSYGIGLNILTYYDKLLRLEYSVNKQKEGGFYLHFEAPF